MVVRNIWAMQSDNYDIQSLDILRQTSLENIVSNRGQGMGNLNWPREMSISGSQRPWPTIY
jgi:hypothetical protein